MKYSKLHCYSDLTTFTNLNTLFLFTPFLLEFLNGKDTAEDTMKEYNKTINLIIEESKKTKVGLLQFRILMRYSPFNKFVDEKSANDIWLKVVGGRDEPFPVIKPI